MRWSEESTFSPSHAGVGFRKLLKRAVSSQEISDYEKEVEGILNGGVSILDAFHNCGSLTFDHFNTSYFLSLFIDMLREIIIYI